jgi:hypothetical protein
MATLDQAIQYAQLFQDIEFSTALQALRQDPQALQRFLQQSQDKLYSGVTAQKRGAFEKIYGDLQQASTANNAVLSYYENNDELGRMQQELYNTLKKETGAFTYDQNLAKRQVELNQWSAGNKLDTLFIYQQLFLILCATTVLVFLWIKGIIGAPLFVGIVLVLVAIFTFTVVERAQFTQFLRDGRYWNRRKFPTYTGIPVPNICDGGLSGAITSAESALQQAEAQATAFAQQAEQSATSAYNQAQQDVQQASQQAQTDISSATTAASNFFSGL